jgi:hypothetical protein
LIDALIIDKLRFLDDRERENIFEIGDVYPAYSPSEKNRNEMLAVGEGIGAGRLTMNDREEPRAGNRVLRCWGGWV